MNYDSFYGHSADDTMPDIPAMAMSEQQITQQPMQAQQAQIDNIYLYPKNLSNALTLIEQAVIGESEDRLFYTYLIENAPSVEDKRIISGIRDNEIKHFGMFRQIYFEITRRTVPAQKAENFVPPASYCEGLKNAIIGETNAVIKYRQILFAMQARVHINMLTEIITDEIRHGILYSYLYSKNGCNA